MTGERHQPQKWRIQISETININELTTRKILEHYNTLAKLVGEENFPVHFHQGQRDNLHITLVSNHIILVVIFDDRSSLGLVRLRVKKASAELAKIFEEIMKKTEQGGAKGGSPFAEITDDDIDNLFSL